MDKITYDMMVADIKFITLKCKTADKFKEMALELSPAKFVNGTSLTGTEVQRAFNVAMDEAYASTVKNKNFKLAFAIVEKIYEHDKEKALAKTLPVAEGFHRKKQFGMADTVLNWYRTNSKTYGIAAQETEEDKKFWHFSSKLQKSYMNEYENDLPTVINKYKYKV